MWYNNTYICYMCYCIYYLKKTAFVFQEAVIREGKLIRELQISTEKNLHLKSKVQFQ